MGFYIESIVWRILESLCTIGLPDSFGWSSCTVMGCSSDSKLGARGVRITPDRKYLPSTAKTIKLF